MKSKKLKNKKIFIKDKIIYEDTSFIHSKCSNLAYRLSNKSLLLTGANGIIGQYLLHTLYKFNETLLYGTTSQYTFWLLTLLAISCVTCEPKSTITTFFSI